MLLKHLRHLTVVADQGSIARAAAVLRVAQPALSREMHALEETLGVQLLERQRRGVGLTAAGQALVRDSAVVIARLTEALTATREAHEGRRGTVRVGLSRVSLDSPRAGRAIAAIRERFPAVRLNVGEVAPFHGASALRAREFDVVLGSYIADDARGLRTAQLYEDRLDSALLPTSHALARSASVTIDALRALPFLGIVGPLDRGYSALARALRAANVAVEDHVSVESLYTLVGAGHGWTVATREQRSHPPAGTTVVPLTGMDLPHPVYARWRAHDSSRATENVVAVLLEELSGGAGGERKVSPVEIGKRKRKRGNGKLPTLELRQLEAFVAAADERSLSRAAERIGMTQSGVSRRLRALEREAGCVLLERVAAGVTLSVAGELLYAEAREVLRLAAEAVARARRIGGSAPPTCRIGTLPPELTSGLQLLALRRLFEIAPGARVDVTEMLPDQQLAALREGRIDVAIGAGMGGGVLRAPAGIASVLLTDDPVECALVAESHPWSTRAWVTAADLAREPFLFIARPSGARLYDAVMRGFGEMGLAPQLGGPVGGPRAAWRGVADGLGWTVAPRSQRSHPPFGTVAVPVEGLHIPFGLALSWRRDEQDPLVLQVLEVFRETRNPEVAVVVATVRASLGPQSVAATG